MFWMRWVRSKLVERRPTATSCHELVAHTGWEGEPGQPGATGCLSYPVSSRRVIDVAKRRLLLLVVVVRSQEEKVPGRCWLTRFPFNPQHYSKLR